jgi:hypothetical protein
MTQTWKAELQAEFERAEAATAAGNQGRMRVCARRAAGIAIREYLTRRGEPRPSQSAYDLLNYLKEQADLPPDLERAAVYLTLRVTEGFELPVEVDLVAEARRLCTALLPDWDR